MDIASVVADAGGEVVGVAGSVRKALGLVERRNCDVAVLDANLNGESAEPVATALRETGAPFVVISGYSGAQLPLALGGAPFIMKPYSSQELLSMLRLLAGQPSG